MAGLTPILQKQTPTNERAGVPAPLREDSTMRAKFFTAMGVAAVLAVATPAANASDQCPGCGAGPGPVAGQRMGAGMTGDPSHMADMAMIHFLLDNGKDVTRTVTVLENGIATVTESDRPEVAATIQKHVAAMYARVKDVKPIHQRDPLFRELFANAAKIVMTHENTPKGVKVTETSVDPYVASLIKAHAEVVTSFIANGRKEAMTNHAVPKK
jgi:hypothetical protein